MNQHRQRYCHTVYELLWPGHNVVLKHPFNYLIIINHNLNLTPTHTDIYFSSQHVYDPYNSFTSERKCVTFMACGHLTVKCINSCE